MMNYRVGVRRLLRTFAAAHGASYVKRQAASDLILIKWKVLRLVLGF